MPFAESMEEALAMDPLVKFLEEDEDEMMHSGADVDAFTAELNRDIEGINYAPPQSSEADNAVSSQESGPTTGHILPHWQTSGDDETVNFQSHQSVIANEEKSNHPSHVELQKNVSESDKRQQDSSSMPVDQSIHSGSQLPDEKRNFFVPHSADGIQTGQHLSHTPEPDSKPNIKIESQMHTLQNPSSVGVGSNDQQSFSTGQGIQQTTSLGISEEKGMPMVNRHGTGVGMSTQLPIPTSNQQSGNTLKLNKQVPFGMLLPIIQPQLDKDRAMQLQTLYIKLKKNEISKDGFVRNMRSIVGDQMLKMAVYKLQTQASRDSQAASSQLQVSPRQMQIPSTSNNQPPDSRIVQGSQIPSSNAPTFGQDRRHPAFPTQGINKQQQAYFPHTSFTQYDSSGSGQSPLLPDNAASSSLQTVSYDSQIRPTSHPSMAVKSVAKFEWAPSDQSNESFGTQASRVPTLPPASLAPTNQMDNSMLPTSRMPSISASLGSGNASKLTPKKPAVGQKKPMETPISSPPSSKKQKVSGGSMDQSIEHLNDVTAVSGVNLTEEEEQLFSGSKEDGRISEASRRVVQEEEERLILQKIPLQKKLVEILAKSGLKNMAADVERCLSFCVEERLRTLISNAIRLSKQRVDIENTRHKITITSDVRQQIQEINNKAREELEKKQSENEKSQSDSASGIDGDKDKEERARAAKANKEEDDKMRATAANVAVRAATGGGDMLSRWQLMIEAKQKQGGSDAAAATSASQATSIKEAPRKTSTGLAKSTGSHQESDKRDNLAAGINTAASIRKVGRNQVVVPRVAQAYRLRI